jgi:methionine aminopeptidase
VIIYSFDGKAQLTIANPGRSCVAAAPAGVPDSRPLQEGDVLNVDVTAYLQGFHGDTNATFCVCE